MDLSKQNIDMFWIRTGSFSSSPISCKKNWHRAFVIALYLINLLHTTTLQFEAHYFKLLDQSPNYNFLKIIGCACFCLFDLTIALLHIRTINASLLMVKFLFPMLSSMSLDSPLSPPLLATIFLSISIESPQSSQVTAELKPKGSLYLRG